MAYIDNFELKKTITQKIRDDLKANPITDGYITIDYVYRENEAKKEDTNFVSIDFIDLVTNEAHKCDEEHITVKFRFFFENELLANKFAGYFKQRYKDFYFIDYIRMFGLKHENTIIEYSKNVYMAELGGYVLN